VDQISAISAKEFGLFRDFIYSQAGINLSDVKKPLVSGRLTKRLHFHRLNSFNDYFRLISDPSQTAEKQIAIDLLTTNETHFFREPKHFDFLKNMIQQRKVRGRPFRVWSAASSSGEEPFTIAMILAEYMGNEQWEVVASDLSTKVLNQAQTGCYSMQRAPEIPRQYLTKYCLRGTGDHEGDMLIVRSLRQRVKFQQLNLTRPYPDLGQFDVIFLRNVMIYFDVDTKRQITDQMLPFLRDDGYFLISHSESLNGVTDKYDSVAPSIYQKAKARS
jgi:chemotaxis protein methyltransferase CheR